MTVATQMVDRLRGSTASSFTPALNRPGGGRWAKREADWIDELRFTDEEYKTAPEGCLYSGNMSGVESDLLNVSIWHLKEWSGVMQLHTSQYMHITLCARHTTCT